jgi:hypothetical protein
MSNKTMLNIIAVTYNQHHELLCFIESILSQTVREWKLTIYHDGPSEKFIEIMNPYWGDDRIQYKCTEIRYNDWGHSLRKIGISEAGESKYTLITNCDNYYAPTFVQEMCNGEEDLVFCNMVHDHWGYQARETVLRHKAIDIGAVVCKTDLVKKVGWKNTVFHADWLFIDEVMQSMKRKGGERKVGKVLFIHN